MEAIISGGIMRHPKIGIASIGVALAAVGSITAAAAGTSAATAAPAAGHSYGN
jgi:hypothetical protein